ncbi:MAG: Cna B-type domain-containing protein [Ruminococcus sp.]|nr:Cna B-type domain-containing protein [Ruminococcus sp.]
MNKRIFSRLLGLIFVFFITAAVLPDKVLAQSDKELCIICEEGSTQVEGMRWRLYKVGERRDGEFVLTDRFATYPVSMKGLTEDNIRETAQALESFVIGDQPDITAEAYTDANGTVRFPDLDTGIYLALSSKIKKDAYTYSAVPLLAEIKEGAETIFPKVYSNATLSSEVRSFTVKKVWVDDDNSYVSRPVNVTVDLFKDGEREDTVTLGNSNDWEYTWTTLDIDADWRVVERNIPRKYSVLVDYNSKQFLIKNSYDPTMIIDGGEYVVSTTTTTVTDDSYNSITTTTTTSKGDSESGTTTPTTDDSAAYTDSTTSVTTEQHGTTVVTTTSGTGSSDSKEKLPQTGQLWWPVFPLIIGGLLMLILGFAIKPRKE